MTDIIVTMPKSRGGLKHLQSKIHVLQEAPQHELGYAWWWVRKANELTTDSNVLIVCEGRLRGWFTVKWIIDLVSHVVNPFDKANAFTKIEFRNPHGTNRIEIPDSTGEVIIKQYLERIDGSVQLVTPYEEFSDADRQILSDTEEWRRNGMQTIFFDEWFHDLEQPEMKGFQGFRYRR